MQIDRPRTGRKLITCLVLVTAITNEVILFSQNIDSGQSCIKGKIYRSLFYFSEITNSNLKYSIYLPPGYSDPEKKFPVFYLLHGLGGNETSWINDFSIHRIADSLIVSGKIPPLIIVMPDGRNSYYINDIAYRFPYQQIFLHELIPLIDSSFKTIAKRENRALGGLSMGGYGTIVNCMKHPEVFSAAIALSAAIRTDSMIINEDFEKYNKYFKPIFGDSLNGKCRMTNHWLINNPLYIINNNPDTLKSVSWYFDCGLSDYLLPGNEAIHDLFVRYSIPHEFHLRSGGHERAYWKAGLVQAMQFVGRIFN